MIHQVYKGNFFFYFFFKYIHSHTNTCDYFYMAQCGGDTYCSLEKAVNVYIYIYNSIYSFEIGFLSDGVPLPCFCSVTEQSMRWKRSAGMAAPYCQRKDLASDWLSPPHAPHSPPLCTLPAPSSPLPEFIVCETVADCLECASLQNRSFMVYSDGRFGDFLLLTLISLPRHPLSFCSSSFF